MTRPFKKLGDLAILVGVQWYLRILICISLMSTTQVEHFHVLIGHLNIFLSKVFKSFAFFFVTGLSFYCVTDFLYICSQYQLFNCYMFCKYFLPVWLAFVTLIVSLDEKCSMKANLTIFFIASCV